MLEGISFSFDACELNINNLMLFLRHLHRVVSRSNIESPRWLANKGKTEKCVKELEKIAKVNNTKVPPRALYDLSKDENEEETVYGALSLFSQWRMAKNTSILSLCW